MSSMVILYHDSIDGVAELWSSSAERLGFHLVRPLRPQDSDRDILRWQDDDLYVSLHMHRGISDAERDLNLVRLVIEPAIPDEALVERILELPLQPVELFLVNFGWEFAAGNLISDITGDIAPADQMDCIESGWTLWGVRSLQALHRDILASVEEWKAAARERGFPLRPHGAYFLLDIHWKDAAPWPEELDPVTGLPSSSDYNEQVDWHMKAPLGTAVMVKLTGLEPNPNRDSEPWLGALPKVAQVLSASLSDGDTLRQFYTPREFVILKSGLAWRDAPAELQRLRTLLQESVRPMRLLGQLTSASWPEEAADREEMICGSGWDKLRDDGQSLPL
jgi:hypothetical protein